MSSCAYIHVSCHKECLLHATTLCFQTHLSIINIIIDVKNTKLLLRSITVTDKSSKKIKDKYMKKCHKLERGYRDCIKKDKRQDQDNTVYHMMHQALDA